MSTNAIIGLISYFLVWGAIATVIYWVISKIKEPKDRFYAWLIAGFILAALFMAGVAIALVPGGQNQFMPGCWRY